MDEIMQKPHEKKLEAGDSVWQQMLAEAETIVKAEPQLATFITSSLLAHETLEQAVAHRVASILACDNLPPDLIRSLYEKVLKERPDFGAVFRADLSAVLDRDPACARLIEPFLFFKGFAALQTQRLAHWLWAHNRKDVALMLQSRLSTVANVDIHPGAKIGRGILLDHASGFVAGETVVIEDNVSIMQNVTLGGSSRIKGSDRHPKIRRGVLIGAGATVLGNIEVGEGARVAASSVVLENVLPHKTVAGIPARVVGDAGCDEPSRKMDHFFSVGEHI
jgi:serine O-acetyltransferase